MDLLHAVAATLVRGLSPAHAAAALKELSTHSADSLTLEELIAACGRDADAGRLAREALAEAAPRLERATAAGILPLVLDDPRYPPMLRAIVDPPPVLWVRGVAEALVRPAVAVVGSRAASPYALEVASQMGAELAERGIAVVSGLARGVDGAAHRGAVGVDGVTIGVLGCGLDIMYPPEHAALAASICKDGSLVSEFAPGVPPLPRHFPLRNRLISGISLAVLVVEASDKSGSLITARCALEQGRDVMAVPGSVLGGRNRGAHALLKDGAKVVETVDDIFEELGWPAPSRRGDAGAPEGGGDPEISRNSLTPDGLLAKLTPGEAYDLDELSATVGVTGPVLLPRLTEWELTGRLRKVAGGRYVLAGRK